MPQTSANIINSMRCPVTPRNNHAKGTIPNNETQTNPNLMETLSAVANEDIENGNVVQIEGIEPNKKPIKTSCKRFEKIWLVDPLSSSHVKL